jgi:hypothetical protein
MLLTLLEWIQNTQVFVDLRSSGYVYPVILAFHLSAISLFGGMIVLSDLCLLGWIPRQVSAAAVVKGLRVPKRIGLLVAATFGFLLFCCKAEQYYYNVYFRTKMLLLALVAVHALVFRNRVYNRLIETAPVGPETEGAPRGSSVSSAVGRHSHGRQGDRICTPAAGASFPIGSGTRVSTLSRQQCGAGFSINGWGRH